MTFVGKMLVVVQLVLSVCFMAFAGAVFTAQTNWKAVADKTNTDLQSAQTSLATRDQELQQSRTDLGAQIAKQAQDLALREGELKQASDQLERTKQELLEARTAVDRQTAVANLSAEQEKFRQEETLRQRDRNERLNEQIAGLLSNQRQLEDSAFSRDLAIEEMREKQDEMIALVDDYRRILASQKLSLDINDYPDLVSAEAPPKVTGRILETRVISQGGQELVVVSLGSDDGFRKGNTLRVFRNSDYLATIELTDVHPDRSVGRVIPNTRTRNGKIQKGDDVTSEF